MHITAPSSAKQGERVTISVSGAPAGTEQIKFSATGNSGFDIISTTSGSASFNLSLDFSGTTTIEILAQDKFGATLASASHSITVKDTGFDARKPPNGRLGGGAVSGPSTATVGDTINFTAIGSGTVEGAVRHLVGARLDASGMRWGKGARRGGAAATLRLDQRTLERPRGAPGSQSRLPREGDGAQGAGA